MWSLELRAATRFKIKMVHVPWGAAIIAPRKVETDWNTSGTAASTDDGSTAHDFYFICTKPRKGWKIRVQRKVLMGEYVRELK